MQVSEEVAKRHEKMIAEVIHEHWVSDPLRGNHLKAKQLQKYIDIPTKRLGSMMSQLDWLEGEFCDAHDTTYKINSDLLPVDD